MSRKAAVLLIDPTAHIQSWEEPKGRVSFWVKGSGWETKLTYSASRAWDLAILEVSKEVGA